MLTLGSLFDGSGGFALAGILNGITPIWASEIEPFPVRVTTKRIPHMKHYGDILSMSGAEIEPVDVITFGSPCTDMSVAGKRSGLDGQQSSLFYQAIRIIKEMRLETHGKYPRFIIWENVPGAFSSAKGEDFRRIIEEIAKIKDETTAVSKPNKWESAGAVMGDTFSIAWRLLDAQFWGVPQRRRRIFLVADFDSQCATEILFEREGVSRNFTQGFYPWKRTTYDAESSTQSTSLVLTDDNLSPTIRAEMGDNQVAFAIENHPIDSRAKLSEDGKVQTLTSRMGTGGMNVPLVMNERQYALTVGEDVVNTLVNGTNPGYQNGVVTESDVQHIVRRLTPTECAMLQGFPRNWCENIGTENPTEEDVAFWTNVWETHRKIMGVSEKPKSRKQIIKWLKSPHFDSAEYKMWGNGVALPCVCFVMAGIAEVANAEINNKELTK